MTGSHDIKRQSCRSYRIYSSHVHVEAMLAPGRIHCNGIEIDSGYRPASLGHGSEKYAVPATDVEQRGGSAVISEHQLGTPSLGRNACDGQDGVHR